MLRMSKIPPMLLVKKMGTENDVWSFVRLFSTHDQTSYIWIADRFDSNDTHQPESVDEKSGDLTNVLTKVGLTSNGSPSE